MNNVCFPELCQHAWPNLRRVVLSDCWPLQRVQAPHLEAYKCFLPETNCDIVQFVENVLVPCADSLRDIELIYEAYRTLTWGESGIHGPVALPRVRNFAIGAIGMLDAFRLFDVIKLNSGIVKRTSFAVTFHRYEMAGAVEKLLDKCSELTWHVLTLRGN